MENIARIREGRLLPAPRTETKKAKRGKKVEDGLREMFDRMGPDQKAQFLKDLGE